MRIRRSPVPVSVLALVAGLCVVAMPSMRATAAGAKKVSSPGDTQVVIELASSAGASVADIERDYGLRVVKDVLASHRIYLMTASPNDADPKAKHAKDLAKALSKDDRLQWAEINYNTDNAFCCRCL